MSKFKTGDIVELINQSSYNRVTIGKRYVVGQVFVDGSFEIPTADDGKSASPYKPEHFKLKGNTMLDSLKDYGKEHKNIIITVILGLMVDHYFFNGVFREKIKALVNGFLDNAQKQLDQKKD